MSEQNAQTPIQAPNSQEQRNVRHKFTKEEDDLIMAGILQYGKQNDKWKQISTKYFQGNITPRQCRGRYHTKLNPDITGRRWTKEEDELLIYLVEKNGTHFTRFVNQFPSRSATQLKCHYLGISERIKAKHKEDNDSKFNALSEETKRDIYESLKQKGSYTNLVNKP